MSSASQSTTAIEPRRRERREFRPKFGQVLIGAASIALFSLELSAGVVGLFLLWKGIDVLPVLLIVCPVTGLLFGLCYVVRFRRRAPTLLLFESDGVVIRFRDGREHRLDWSEARSAWSENDTGLVWRIHTDDDWLEIRDDGLSTSDWDAIGARVRAECAARGLRCEMTGPASVFEDSPVRRSGGG